MDQEATRFAPDLELRQIRRGSKPGSAYVRLTPRRERLFERVEAGEYRATDVAIRPRTTAERLWRGLKRVLVGRPLATSQLIHERLSKVKALPIFASDNLSSSAYATEEMLLILVLAGTAALSYSIPISIAIVGLVATVALSYSQVIRGYPNGGGAYVVARENLGAIPGVVAGASLIADYVLLVAVSVAAGVAAVTSAIPELHDFRVPLAVGCVGFLTVVNLRGTRESATVFVLPTYLFIFSFGALIVVGFARILLGHDLTAEAPPDPVKTGELGLTAFLVLRAFSSGSAALTGIEAVSNGVPSFKAPESRNASIVLVWMAAILALFFLGTTVLAHQVHAVPSETRTIVAQIADSVFGGGPLFYIVQLATMLVLLLAANTSFAGLPALASVMASDRFLPRQFAFRGDRLAFSNGIIVLGLAAAALLVVFRAETHSIIPLYAVGVFVGFTLAQLGLVIHWRRQQRTAGARASLAINACGAAVTTLVTVIVASTKFVDGAWITIGVIALLAYFSIRIHRHYRDVSEQLAVAPGRPVSGPLQVTGKRDEPVVLMPIEEVNQAVLATLAYALTISRNVTAIHVTDDLELGERVRVQWERSVSSDAPIVIIESPYRSLLAPILAYVDALDRAQPGTPVTVVLPEFVPRHAWQRVLHNQSAKRLQRALIGRPNTYLINVPLHLRA